LIKGVERDQPRYGDSRDEQRGRYQDRTDQDGRRDEAAAGRANTRTSGLEPRLLPPLEERPGRWYAKERDERETGARSKTTNRWQENRQAGEQDRQDTRTSRQERDERRRTEIVTVRESGKRTRWSRTSSEDEGRPATNKQRR
jgi:hypothetical protein